MAPAEKCQLSTRFRSSRVIMSRRLENYILKKGGHSGYQSLSYSM